MRKRLKNALIPHSGNGRHPHIFRKKAVIATLGIVLGIQVMVLASTLVLPRFGLQYAAILPSVVALLTNEVRAEASLPALETSELLTKAAQAKADDMATKGYFAHQSPNGWEPWHWISQTGYKYVYAGENLAVNFHDSKDVVKAWQNSPTHNMNLVGSRYTEIGIGMARGEYKGREAIFVVQMFASPQPASPTAPVTRQPVVSTPQVGPNTSVLGAETVVEEIAPVTNEGQTSKPSVVSRAVSSPRTYSTYAYSTIAGLIMLLLVLGLTPLHERHHPKAALNGVLVVAVIAGLMIVDKNMVFTPVELPSDSQNAAVALSL